MTVNPDTRATAKDVLTNDKWMKQGRANDLTLSARTVDLTELRKFNAKRKWKAAVDLVSSVLCEINICITRSRLTVVAPHASSVVSSPYSYSFLSSSVFFTASLGHCNKQITKSE